VAGRQPLAGDRQVVGEGPGAGDHPRDRVELVPVQRLVGGMHGIERQPVQPHGRDLLERIFLGDRVADRELVLHLMRRPGSSRLLARRHDAVAGLEVDLGTVAAVEELAGANGHDFGFLLTSAVVTTAVWLPPLVSALVRGAAPALLDVYTTPVTSALDLAVITPAAALAGLLVRRREPLGYLLAAPHLYANYGTLRFLAIAAERYDIESPAQFRELVAKHQRTSPERKGALIIALPNQLDNLLAQLIRSTFTHGYRLGSPQSACG